MVIRFIIFSECQNFPLYFLLIFWSNKIKEKLLEKKKVEKTEVINQDKLLSDIKPLLSTRGRKGEEEY